MEPGAAASSDLSELTLVAPIAGTVVALTALVSIVLTLLRAPLMTLLVELCNGVQRARFWWRVAATELVVGTALCSSVAVLVGGRGAAWSAAAAMWRGGCGGVLLAVAAITVGTVAIARSARVTWR